MDVERILAATEDIITAVAAVDQEVVDRNLAGIAKLATDRPADRPVCDQQNIDAGIRGDLGLGERRACQTDAKVSRPGLCHAGVFVSRVRAKRGHIGRIQTRHKRERQAVSLGRS